MNKIIKLVFLTALFVFSVTVVSCSGDASTNDDEQNPWQEIQVPSELLPACEVLSIETETAESTITLPRVSPQYPSISISWVSSDSTVIAVSEESDTAAVTRKTGSEYDNVTLTATLKDKTGASLTKTFTVKVLQTEAQISDEQLLSMAEERFVSIVKVPGTVWIQYAVGDSFTVAGKTVTVTASTDDTTGFIAVEPQNVITLKRTLEEKTVKLNIRFAVAESTAEKTSEFTFVLPSINILTKHSENTGTKTDTVTEKTVKFNPQNGTFEYIKKDTTTYKEDSNGQKAGTVIVNNDGVRGSYVFDSENNTIRLTFTEKFGIIPPSKQAEWLNRTSYLSKSASFYRSFIHSMEVLETSPTVDSYYACYSTFLLLFTGATPSREYMFEDNFKMTEEEFNALPAEQKTEKLNGLAAGVLILKPSMLKSLGLSADASYPEIYSQLNTLASDPSVLDDEFLTDSPFEFVLDYKTPDAAAEYAVLGWPSITAKYNSALPWYKQYGKYRLSGYFSGEYSYYLADDDEVEWERTSYNDGTWNESYTVYTATVTKKITGDDGQQTEQTETVVFNLTDNKDGTVTLAKAGSDPVTLSFEGKTLVN